MFHIALVGIAITVLLGAAPFLANYLRKRRVSSRSDIERLKHVRGRPLTGPPGGRRWGGDE